MLQEFADVQIVGEPALTFTFRQPTFGNVALS
ncbi:Uncharacterised protein [Vibrio cholerae]|nr:Uncharacterised protein [Vibrio cholerae]CSI29097.1 Uncharacterised protein [Vibrio cholerae]CSI46924.1 Uncharacterised protein [Vibrio cholerae]